ncbi:hypothetical protein [Paenibacillus sp. GYB003]|uniref:hypothetical protein n=1 Tax=Paenibacillus sp. GYB003 TaxID=2994392 RepID=UPI002F965C0E
MPIDKAVAGLGFIAAVGGATRMLMTPFSLLWGANGSPELWAGLLACWLMAVGTLGLFLVQASRTGVLGFASSLAIAASNMITGCLVWSTMLGAEPTGYELVRTVNDALMLLGLLVFGIVTWRARVLPRWAAVLTVVWPVVGFFPFLGDYMALLWGLAYVGLGVPAWLGNGRAAA